MIMQSQPSCKSRCHSCGSYKVEKANWLDKLCWVTGPLTYWGRLPSGVGTIIETSARRRQRLCGSCGTGVKHWWSLQQRLTGQEGGVAEGIQAVARSMRPHAGIRRRDRKSDGFWNWWLQIGPSEPWSPLAAKPFSLKCNVLTLLLLVLNALIAL